MAWCCRPPRFPTQTGARPSTIRRRQPAREQAPGSMQSVRATLSVTSRAFGRRRRRRPFQIQEPSSATASLRYVTLLTLIPPHVLLLRLPADTQPGGRLCSSPRLAPGPFGPCSDRGGGELGFYRAIRSASEHSSSPMAPIQLPAIRTAIPPHATRRLNT